MTPLLCMAIGFIGGMLGGALGIGGGAVMVPALVLLFGMSQHQAQGTILAVLLAPVFILAVLRYHAEGHVNVQMAIFIALGFVFGALIGAHWVQGIPDAPLKKAFGLFLILIGLKMAWGR